MAREKTLHDSSEDFSFDWSLNGFEDEPATVTFNNPGLPVTLNAGLIPLDRDGLYVPNHLDAHGTVHWFSVVEAQDAGDDAYELRYFRAARTHDGRLVHDAHQVLPLDNDGASPFPLPQLQMMLEDGDLENAQELAYHAARSHGLTFPDPAALPDLNTNVDYGFQVGVGDDWNPTLEAVKRWRNGNEDREARLTVASYGMSEAAALDQQELTDLRDERGLEAAMNLAESMAVASGRLHDGRDDPRLFTNGPPDPFTTNLERERATQAAFIREYGDDDTKPLTPVTVAPEATVEQFRERFSDSAYRLLEPVDRSVNYSFKVMAADPWTLELTADKWWLDDKGHVAHDSQALNAYSLESYEFEREIEREVAAMDREALERTYQDDGLEAAMRKAEAMAVANLELDPQRADGRLFQQGPPDRFVTLREVELAGLDAPLVVECIRDITDDDTQSMPAVTPEPGTWDELMVQQDADESGPERHYWQMHYHPVETPEGEPLGTALFVTEFPQLPPNFDEYIEENGMDDSVYPTEARTLEMAHFADEKDAKKFDAEFRGYLVPGLLDGPELAPEVAKLEGLSGEWEDMNYRGIVDYMSGSRTIVREADDWHLHNPNAEHEAREQFEDTQTDIDF